MLNWLYLDLNSYFASVEQHLSPPLRGRPVAVVPMMTDSTCAIAASYEAKSFGIKTGTKIYEARRLCPQLTCVLARHDEYVRYHRMILAEVERHIHINHVCSIDEVACRLLGGERLADAAKDLAQKIKAGIRDNIGISITCSIGIAPNMFLAKVASDMQKPDGLIILEEENMKEKILRLELSDLPGIGRNMQARLARAGIWTVAQLWDISPKHARKIWHSVEGERFWHKLRGADIEPIPRQSKSVIGHSRVLDPDQRHSDKAWLVAQSLTLKAAARLRRYDLYTKRFSLSVRDQAGRRFVRDLTFKNTQDSIEIMGALHELWQEMLGMLGYKNHIGFLKKVSISLSGLSTPAETTGDLFEFAEEHHHGGAKKQNPAGKISRAMDALNQRYGADAVTFGFRPKTKAGFVGTKIAFTRIPEIEEFRE